MGAPPTRWPATDGVLESGAIPWPAPGLRRLTVRQLIGLLGSLHLTVNCGPRDAHQLGQFGLGVLPRLHEVQQEPALGGRQLGLLAPQTALDLGDCQTSRVRARIRSASIPATIDKALNSTLPTGSLGS